MKTKNFFLLTLTAFIWGIAFVAQSAGGDAVGPYSFNCIRSFIGALFLLVIIFFTNKKNENKSSFFPSTHVERKKLILGGIFCGFALFVASNLQQMGLYFGSSAGKAGFLTACYILIVPILGIFIGKKCTFNIWIGVLFALAGLYMLCLKGSFRLQLSDILLLLCALVFALHILIIDYFNPFVSGVKMSCIQFFVCGILTSFPMFYIDMGHSLSGIKRWLPLFSNFDAWIPLLYGGILSCGVAYTLQIIGQKGTNPTIASLLLSLESVFAVIAGFVLLNQKMGMRELFGCLLIFVAIVLAQLPVKSKN